MVVALDGPAGVGKSTLAKHLAHRWNLHYLNTGRYYRTVTLLALEQGLVTAEGIDTAGVIALVGRLTWGFHPEAIVVDGRTLAQELHSARVDAWVAPVSAIPEVRARLNEEFRALGRVQDLICEGRDITSVVFPEAEVRVFLDASAEVRAQRRFQERPENQSYEQILASIVERDRIDRSKPVGALRWTPGCHLVDTSSLTIEAVCERVDRIVREHRH